MTGDIKELNAPLQNSLKLSELQVGCAAEAAAGGGGGGVWLRNVCRCIEWRKGHRKGERLPTTQIAPDCEEHTRGRISGLIHCSTTGLPLLMALISPAVNTV